VGDQFSGMTPLAVSALALLEERPMHPYEMLQLLRMRGKAEMFAIKGGSLYHTMSRLADLGLAEVHGTERDGNRPERTVYRLTETGRHCYVAWVRSRLRAPTTPQEYAVALAEAHNLGAGEVTAILRDRRDQLTTAVQTLRSGLDSARQRCVPEAYFLEHSRRLALLECDLAWTASVLHRLSTSDLAWPHDDHAQETDATGRTKEKPA
jgi:DNA-binding PadR family transcriptional regulator